MTRLDVATIRVLAHCETGPCHTCPKPDNMAGCPIDHPGKLAEALSDAYKELDTITAPQRENPGEHMEERAMTFDELNHNTIEGRLLNAAIGTLMNYMPNTPDEIVQHLSGIEDRCQWPEPLEA